MGGDRVRQKADFPQADRVLAEQAHLWYTDSNLLLVRLHEVASEDVTSALTWRRQAPS